MDKWERASLRDEVNKMVGLFSKAGKAQQAMRTETNPSKLAKAQEEWETLAGQAMRARDALFSKIDEM